MSSITGNALARMLLGQSHGSYAGIVGDQGQLNAFMQRRSQGNSSATSARQEADSVNIVSGMVEGKTCAAPLRV